jgi:hypothetical protein
MDRRQFLTGSYHTPIIAQNGPRVKLSVQGRNGTATSQTAHGYQSERHLSFQ